MLGNEILHSIVDGHVTTDGDRSNVKFWKEKLKQALACYDVRSGIPKLSVKLKFWLCKDRITSTQKNDLDNLIKPVLDVMKQSGIYSDDASVFHLEASKHSTDGDEYIEVSVREWY